MKSYLIKSVLAIFLFLLLGCSKTLEVQENESIIGSNSRSLKMGDEVRISFFIDDGLDADEYKISPGDKLRIEVLNEKDFSRNSVLVMLDGKISLPKVGLMYVKGKTIKELTFLLNSKYTKQGDLRTPDVSVELKEGQNRLHNFVESIFKQFDQGGLRFLVSNHDELELPYIEPIKLVDKPFNHIRRLIRSAYKKEFGDKLIVTVNRNVQYKDKMFYIIGEVKSAGAFPLTNRINIINAVAISGGFTYRANKSIFDIKRKGSDLDSEWFSVDLETIVMPGDIIRVNERYF